MRRPRLLTVLFAVVTSAQAACGGAHHGADSLSGRLAGPPPEQRHDLEMPPTGKLPEDVTPRAYEVRLALDPSAEHYAGEVAIELDLAQARDTIWMHGQGQRVSAVQVAAGGPAQPAAWEPVPGTDGVVAVRLREPVGPGRVTLSAQFEASWDPGLEGLYRVRTADRWYAFTQFESIRARVAFPCFDEPRFKTPFSVQLTVPDGLVAVSNAREQARTPAGTGQTTVRFATTAPLPTYLVAFAVGPFDVVDGPPLPAPDGGAARPLRGIAPSGRGAELAEALAETPRMVATLERILGIPYPYDKLDMIAVPDFRSGAMENAGAITFREQLLLMGPSASAGQRRAFRSVAAHELAHMWFGDLVTMPWWNDIWLNEAFASWMGPRVVEELYPADRVGESFVDSAQGAMGSDSRVSARMIRQPIASNDDIENAFDSITYSKGAAVLAMFESWLGRDDFLRGIRLYLSQHRHATATSEDLLAALEAEAGERPIGAAMRTFLDRPGVPLVEARPECGPERATVALKQSRYLPIGSSGNSEETWQVPVCVRVPAPGGSRTTCTLLTEREGTITLEADVGCPAWVMPNAGATGYYRFTMPADALRALRERGWRALDVRERLSFADSLQAGVSSGAIAIADALDALEPLANEPSRLVAQVPMDLLATIDETMIDEALRPKLRSVASALFRPRLARLGWTVRRGEDDEVHSDRAAVLGFLTLRARDPDTRARAATLGRRLVGLDGRGATRASWHPEAVDADLQSTVLAVAVQEGDAAFFDAVLVLLRSSDDATIRERLVGALASAERPELAAKALALTLDPSLRDNEIPSVLWHQTWHRETRDATWAFVRERFVDLTARLARGYRGYLPRLGGRFCDATHRAEIESFFGPRVGTLTGGPRNLAQTLEGIDLCIARNAAQADSARRWLQARR